MEEDVLRLQVTVDDIVAMQVFHCLTDLLHHLSGLFLRKASISFPWRAEEVAIETGF